MASDRWLEIDRLFHGALDRPPEERAAFLDEACAGDEVLRREVQSLLSHEVAAGEFLVRPALHEAAEDLAGDVNLSSFDPQVTGYTIVRTLGEGGMGVVYLAEQLAPIRRQVALKLIKHGMDTRQVIARFEIERQALALMHHPHIAAVFDAGTTGDGRPYFVMEYVDGLPITDYCDRHRLSTRARLELFVRVCQAVQHAHQKGVIHRDLKPSNVLVADDEGGPLPKIIDFGVARAVDRSKASGFTELGMMVGTPEYMSPEQAALSDDIDTTTDVYSLGVLLYELLAGALPFDPKELRAAGYDEMRRMIRESDPVRPSARLTPIRSAAEAAAGARQTDAGRLTRELRGDLDWITLKALEKDRRQRYATVAAFATDIAHYLADEPISARPPSAAYRARKFARRYRVAVIGAAAVLLALVAGLAVSISQYARAERQRAEADRQRIEADRHRDQAEVQRTAAETLAQEAAAQRSAALVATDEAERHRTLAIREAAAAVDARREAEYREYVATISAADGELRSNFPGQARQRLLAVPPAQRGWEWDHLFLKTDTSLLTLASDAPCVRRSESTEPFAQSDNALVLRVSGTRIFVRRCDAIDVWDRRTFARVTYQAPGRILAIGAAGEVLAAVPSSVERRGPLGPWHLRLLNPASGQTLHQFGPFKVEPICGDVSPDGTRLAIGWRPEANTLTAVIGDDVFETWDVRTGRQLARLAPSKPPLLDTRFSSAPTCMVAFSPDSLQVVTSGATVHVWSADSGRQVVSDRSQAGWVAQPVAFSPDGSRLAIGRLTGVVEVLSLTSDGPPQQLEGGGLLPALPPPEPERRSTVGQLRKRQVLSVAFSPDGGRLITGTATALGIWDLAQGRLTRELIGHTTDIIGVAAEASGHVISADASGRVKFWSSQDWGGVTRLPVSRGWRMGLNPPGTVAAIGQSDGGMTVWRLDDLRQVRLQEGSGKPDPLKAAYSVMVTPDGERVLAGERDGSLREWRLPSPDSVATPVNQVPEPGCEPYGLGFVSLGETALSPDGLVVAFRQARCVVVKDLATKRTLATMKIAATLLQSPKSLQFLPDGSLIISTGSDALTVTDVRTPDRVLIWDWRVDKVRAEMRPPRAAPPPENWSWHVTASADGRRVAMYAPLYSQVLIWDGTLRRQLGRLPVPLGTRIVALSPDGLRVATAGTDNVVRVWDTDRLQLLLILSDDEPNRGFLAFAADGRLVAMRSSGGLTIWESKKRTLPVSVR